MHWRIRHDHGGDRGRLQGLHQAHGAGGLLTGWTSSSSAVASPIRSLPRRGKGRQIAIRARHARHRRKAAGAREQRGAEIPLPVDVVVARSCRHGACRCAAGGRVADDEMILDIGPDTAELFCECSNRPAPSSGTARWAYSSSINSVKAHARSPMRSRAARRSPSPAAAIRSAAIEKYGVEDGISYISTGGGAFLEFVEGKTLPAVAMLERRAACARSLGRSLSQDYGYSCAEPRLWRPSARPPTSRAWPASVRAGLDVAG